MAAQFLLGRAVTHLVAFGVGALALRLVRGRRDLAHGADEEGENDDGEDDEGSDEDDEDDSGDEDDDTDRQQRLAGHPVRDEYVLEAAADETFKMLLLCNMELYRLSSKTGEMKAVKMSAGKAAAQVWRPPARSLGHAAHWLGATLSSPYSPPEPYPVLARHARSVPAGRAAVPARCALLAPDRSDEDHAQVPERGGAAAARRGVRRAGSLSRQCAGLVVAWGGRVSCRGPPHHTVFRQHVRSAADRGARGGARIVTPGLGAGEHGGAAAA